MIRKEGYAWKTRPGKLIGHFQSIGPDMQIVTNFTLIKFQNIFLPKKRVNHNKQSLPTKQRTLYFHIIDIHTQGYIALNKYIIGIASIGLPKVNLCRD